MARGRSLWSYLKGIGQVLGSRNEWHRPNIERDRFIEISATFLKSQHITHLIIDLDQTFVPHGSDSPSEADARHLEALKSGLGSEKICFLTNKPDSEREKNITEITGVRVVSGDFRKPDKEAYENALRSLNTRAGAHVAMIGDRIWTDIIGANMIGLTSIYVKPVSPSLDSVSTSVLRQFEKVSRRRGFFSGTLATAASVLTILSFLGITGATIGQLLFPLIFEKASISAGQYVSLEWYVVFCSIVFFSFYAVSRYDFGQIKPTHLPFVLQLLPTYPSMFRLSLATFAYIWAKWPGSFGALAEMAPNFKDVILFYMFFVYLSLAISCTFIYHNDVYRFVRLTADCIGIAIVWYNLPSPLSYAVLCLYIFPVASAVKHFNILVSIATLLVPCGIVWWITRRDLSDSELAAVGIVIFLILAVYSLASLEKREGLFNLLRLTELAVGSPRLDDPVDILMHCAQSVMCEGVYYLDARNIVSLKMWHVGMLPEFSHEEFSQSEAEEMRNFLGSHPSAIYGRSNLADLPEGQSLRRLRRNFELLRGLSHSGKIRSICVVGGASNSTYLVAYNDLARNGVHRRRFPESDIRMLAVYTSILEARVVGAVRSLKPVIAAVAD